MDTRTISNTRILPKKTTGGYVATDLFDQANSYLNPSDVLLLKTAYEFSETAHRGQFRKTGEPYVSHPISVAHILTDWRLDVQTLSAALLHDVVEDTATTTVDIQNHFGEVIAELVDGVSKLDQIKFESKAHRQAENFRKMLLAMSRDVRVMLIKLADRLHNMRTLGSIYRKKRLRIAQETAEIYAPIANRLGLNNVFEELQELSFRHLYPNRFKVITKALKKARGNRKELVESILDQTRDKLKQQEINSSVTGREKNTFSVYRKMREKTLSFAEVYDIYGFRVIVDDITKCYQALGALHQMFKPVPGKFKDYIAMPKNNGYQSLHTTLLGPYGTPIEMQIRTKEMHRIAEAGLASHWLYKESGTSLTNLQTKTHQWLQNLLEIHMESGSSTEFLEHLRVDLFPDEVYVLTPKGDIMSLPYQATCVDFAYAVHTDIGNQTVAAKINHELVPLRKRIKTGDRVEIITTDNAKPNSSWLDFVVTAKARHGIRHRLKTMQHDEAAQLGSQILAGALRALDPTNTGLALNSWEEIAPRFADKSKNQILSDIGLGKTLAIAVARSLLMQTDEKKIAENTENSPEQLLIRGSAGMTLEFGMCCNPIPGDPIIGHMKKGTGLIIHTHDCKTLSAPGTQNVKFLDVAWSDNTDKMFTVKISLIVSDAQGVLAKVASEITKTDSNIQSAIAEPGDSSAYSSMIFTIQVENRMHLATVMRSLRKIPAVIRINRMKSQ